MENRPGPTKKQIVQSLSIAKELKEMFDIAHRVSKELLTEDQTDISRKFVFNIMRATKTNINSCSTLEEWHRQLLGELMIAENLLKPPKSKGRKEKSD